MIRLIILKKKNTYTHTKKQTNLDVNVRGGGCGTAEVV